MATSATRNVQESTTAGTLFVAFELSEKTHIPTDVVVAEEASDVESSSRLDFLVLHNLRRRFVA